MLTNLWIAGPITICVAWAAAELIAWAVMRSHVRRKSFQLLVNSALDQQGRRVWPVRPHPLLNFVPTPSFALDGINRQGFRSSPLKDDFSGTRVYMAGDCTIFDPQVPFESALAGQLEKKLNSDASSPAEIINAGCAHYTSLHSLNRFIVDAQGYDIDLCLIATGINDVLSCVHTDGVPERDFDTFYWTYSGLCHVGDSRWGRNIGVLRRFPSTRLATYLALRSLVNKPWNRNFIRLRKNYASADNIKRCYERFHTGYFRQNLDSFIDLCRARRIQPVLLTNYYRDEDMGHPVRKFYAYGFDLINDEIRRVAADRDVPLLDMRTDFVEHQGMVRNKWHFTHEGNTTRAEIIGRFLTTRGLIEKSTRMVGVS